MATAALAAFRRATLERSPTRSLNPLVMRAGGAGELALRVPPSHSRLRGLRRRPPGGARRSLAEVFVSFKLRDFRYLTLSTLAAGFAQWAKQIALFALIFDMTGSAVQLGTIAAFRGGGRRPDRPVRRLPR